MESLSSEHIGAFNRQVEGYQGYTPFLDSLIDHSIAFNGFANAKQSIEGLPAIIASIPALMDRPFITSAFAGNSFDALAALLEKKGYETSFFHGGTNGTMDFDRFARASGFKRYYGRNEYDNDMDFDGRWGIFDEPFFQFFAKKT
jgi:phosphoglycerol transferase MdoB-like AlkP superfamily enzyme